MKLVAVSVVRNESDIVEAFVRHTAAWVDHHLIIDCDSTDGTRQILATLLREGMRITLFTGNEENIGTQLGIDHLRQIAFATHGANWVLTLGADEFLAGSARAALEQQLASVPADHAVSVAARSYVPTPTDDAGIRNPVLRIQHRQHGELASVRVFVPRTRTLAHPLEGDARTLTDIWIARFALRSPQQQVLQVVVGELQRLSRGRAHAGLNTHNRLGFQLLAEDPDEFFSVATQPVKNLVFDPVPYADGRALRYTAEHREIVRSARAFLPFLENLARSHGQLVDRTEAPAGRASAVDSIQLLDPATVSDLPDPDRARFSGFVPLSGWQPQEGPVPSAFLPAFHWGTAPETALIVHAKAAGVARLRAEVLTYAERQVTTVVLNGAERLRHVFTQVNQKETLTVPLKLRAGENRLVFRHRSWLHSTTDPRKLALIFLGLQIEEI
jgi:hypothetical protein